MANNHFVTLEGFTPAELKSKDESLQISYGIHDSPFGKVFLATTKRCVCYLIFLDQGQRHASIDQAISELQSKFQGNDLCEDQKLTELFARKIFTAEKEKLSVITVGTKFQISVWKALLHIPYGEVSTYGQVAEMIGKPKASRAVGSAVGANPISFIIPCHRVILSSGEVGNYRWGTARKKAILALESQKLL